MRERGRVVGEGRVQKTPRFHIYGRRIGRGGERRGFVRNSKGDEIGGKKREECHRKE